jgi:hypothetical protein
MGKDTKTGSPTGTPPAVADKQDNADDVHKDIYILILFSWHSFLLDFTCSVMVHVYAQHSIVYV